MLGRRAPPSSFASHATMVSADPGSSSFPFSRPANPSLRALLRRGAAALVLFVLLGFPSGAHAQDAPFFEAELLFPLEHWHNHASSIVELPSGDLLVCWYHGSGERQADDVVIQAARKPAGSEHWNERFTIENVPGYPDANPTFFLDDRERLWLLWPTILANEWHTALMKYRISTDYDQDPPTWSVSRVMHLKPGEQFLETVRAEQDRIERPDARAEEQDELREHLAANERKAADKYYRRLGWMTRAHPTQLPDGRILVPLYSDGFSISLMAITDDGGRTWSTSEPLVGLGNIQPTIARRSDGTLVAYMRDNGPPPKRMPVSTSDDEGATWSSVRDGQLPNPGSGAEVTELEDGTWAMVYNDTEEGRHRLAIALSDDEGASWPVKRYIERDPDEAPPEEKGEYGYPSIVQAEDGTIHVTYSYFHPPGDSKTDEEGRLIRKSIKHARFNQAWVRE